MKIKTKKPLACIILAAGKGTRMKSNLPKVMHKLAGFPLICHVMRAVEALEPDHIIPVIAPDMDSVRDYVLPHQCAVQAQQKGTGDAVKAARDMLKGFDGDVLILVGDCPLISTEALSTLIEARHADKDTGLSVLGMRVDDPSGYGRLIQNKDGSLKRIVEDTDCSDGERAIDFCNAGLFCVDGACLFDWLERVGNNNKQGEYYLVDIPAIAAKDGVKCAVVEAGPDETMGINSRAELALVEVTLQDHMREAAMNGGATLSDPATVYFAADTVLGRDVVIGQNVVFGPGVVVGDGVDVLPFCHFESCKIGAGVTIGPFARLRPGTVLEDKVKIGNFVEVKNSHLGKGSKINHLSYVGDTDMGAAVNFSAGAITVNYDGFEKHRTTIGDHVMIGCNANLVAPITVGSGAYVAAGSTLTEDVTENALALARSRTILRDGWADDFRSKKKKA